ncbi:MAG: shikimate kinase [Anaerovibrio sp.]|uniref:shikimate kinase n=1 Tax=Anaerovibrio sp. TaxID=1872532 RepID=UPI0025D96B25|nr:shikimate kinase [Anaerovibrio sp.]MCR5177280.1 shikimate kinase [Anaerovibrio sp.]
MKNVVLIGFMGVGKTSSGRMLANQLGFKFIDMDKAIEKKWNMTIPQMFEQYGEAFFREKEKEMCREIAEKKSVVISTGGGTVKDPENVSILKRTGKIVCLTASVDAILERTATTGTRPLLDSFEDRRQGIIKLLDERKEMYAQADYTLDTTDLSPLQVSRDVISFMKRR